MSILTLDVLGAAVIFGHMSEEEIRSVMDSAAQVEELAVEDSEEVIL